MTSHRKHLKIILLFLLPAVVWLFINATVNNHIHRFSDGIYIAHAHPYHKNTAHPGPVSNHQHSKGQYLILQLISTAASLQLIIFSICFSAYIACKQLKVNTIQTRFVEEYYGIVSYRGPPAI